MAQGPMSLILVTIQIQKSEIWIYWIIKLPTDFDKKFYGELGCCLESN